MSKDLGKSTSYAYYVAEGGTKTPQEYGEMLVNIDTVATRAEDAADSAAESATGALNSKNAAQTAATTATNKASEAASAAQTATTKAGEASTSASTATSAKDTAVSASQTATTKATEATTAAATATSAKTDAVAANTAAQSAKTAAQTAQTGAETAAASVQSSAAQIATNAADISQLKSEIADKSDTADMLKAFPTDTASGSVASFADGANVPVKSLIVNIDPVQSGTGDPSPDNVRPITGWTGCEVTKTGKNLFEFDATKATTGTTTSETTRAYYPIGLTNCTLTFSAELVDSSSVTNTYINIGKLVNGKLTVLEGFIANTRITTKTATFSENEQAVFITADTSTMSIINNFPKYKICVSTGSTATPYEPYNGQTISVDWTTEAGTVYGGKLDVVSGELVIDMAMADMGDLIWTYNTSQAVFISGSIKTVVGRGTKIVCSTYKMTDNLQESALASLDKVIGCNKAPTQTTGNFQYGVIVVKDTAYTDETAFKTAVTGQTLVYELATPITIQLTPHEVTALLGSNNVWADSGDSTVEYRADPTLYIQRLTEPDADMVADANITSGQYFMVGNTLYKATANIASGGAIIPNVNCTRKSLSEALNELNA